MKRVLHIPGFNYAEALIRAGKIDFGDRVTTTSEWEMNNHISTKGYGSFSQWHLGSDEDIADNNTRSKWSYCFTSDFYNVNRALLVQILESSTGLGDAETDIASKVSELIAAIDVKQMSVQFGAVSITAPTAADKKGWKWNVTIIRAGETLTNPPMYVPVTALHASVDVFEGAKVYANSVADRAGHKSNRNEKVPSDVIAVLSKPYVDGEELKATMSILPSGQWLRDNLIALNEDNMIDTVYQLSVDSSVDAKRALVASLNKTLPVVNRIVRADVDIVGEAAAGGRINRLAASKQSHEHNHNNQKGTTTMRQKLLSLLFFFPALLAGKTADEWMKVEENQMYSHLLQAGKGFLPSSLPDGMTDQAVDTLVASYRENAARIVDAKFENGVLSLQAAKADPPPAPAVNPPVDKNILSLQAALDEQKKVTDNLMKEQCASLLASRVATLPVPLKEAITKKFSGKVFSVGELESAISDGRELIAPFMGGVNDHGLGIRAGMDSFDKLQAGMDMFFLASNQGLNPMKPGTDEYKQAANGISPFRSLREFYIVATGDTNVTGRQDRNMRLTASLESSDWADIISTAMNKRLVRDYLALNLETWRAWVTLRDGVTNFKQQEAVRYGGYSNLPTVAEGGAYTGLTSPDDEKAYWSPSKKGGTEDITREMIMNDDVSALQRIPTRMARAAAQTLHEFIYDFIRPSVNPTIYDSVALYHASHGNTATAALDATALKAARLRMKKQTMLSSGKRLGIRAGFLIVPSDLEVTAYGLLTPAFDKSNGVPEFLQQIGLTPIVVDYWTDPTDWVLAARKEDTEMVEIGFVNGQETPQTFISDLPNVGSMFTNDKITYKIRHEYGGAIVDYRGLDGNIVAG